MRIIRIALLFPLLLYFSSIKAQDVCGFDAIHKQLLKNDRDYKKKVEESEKAIQQRIITKSRTTKIDNQLHRIPVVVHVIHRGEALNSGANISDAQIQSAINAMNQYYNGTLGNSVNANIEFVLATRDPNCNPTNGIVRVNGNSVSGYSTDGLIINGYAGANELAIKNLSRWPSSDYYNIWVVSEINNNNGGSGIQGFAYFPGASASVDGTVILFNAFGYDPAGTQGYNLKSYTNRNTVLTHELGHALNLYHTFEGDDPDNDGIADQCAPNNPATCTTDGDRVCDTDPHRRTPSTCPSTSNTNVCTGVPLGNIIRNYMDYSSEVCQDRFTAGQVERMRAALESSRASLLTSHGINGAYPVNPYVAPGSSCAPATSSTGLSNHYAGIMNVTVNNRVFNSSTARGDGGYRNTTNSCLNLIPLFSGNTYNFSATVWAANNEHLRAWIDYNNDGVFDNATETIHFNPSIPAHPTDYVTTSGTFTIPTSGVTLNTVLRLRVMDEIGNIPGACHNPAYGQAEDYAVYISPSSLPVTLVNFDGAVSKGSVKLTWQTSNEEQALNFEVERSVDGMNFTKLGTIKAKGNSTVVQPYEFFDYQPLSVSHYRLKMNSINSFEYSKVVTIRSSASGGISVMTNPFTNYIDLKLAKNTKQLRLKLINANGVVVLDELRSNVNENFRWMIKDHTIVHGVYILHVTADDQTHTFKVLKN